MAYHITNKINLYMMSRYQFRISA